MSDMVSKRVHFIPAIHFIPVVYRTESEDALDNMNMTLNPAEVTCLECTEIMKVSINIELVAQVKDQYMFQPWKKLI